jgi:hypothetical protein
LLSLVHLVHDPVLQFWQGFVGRALGDPGLKPTVRVGEAAMREVAAYLLDHDGFAKVPPTVLVRVSHPVFHVAQPLDGGAAPSEPPEKLASLQEFVTHECDTRHAHSPVL